MLTHNTVAAGAGTMVVEKEHENMVIACSDGREVQSLFDWVSLILFVVFQIAHQGLSFHGGGKSRKVTVLSWFHTPRCLLSCVGILTIQTVNGGPNFRQWAMCHILSARTSTHKV